MSKKRTNFLFKKQGFSLIETVVTMVILAFAFTGALYLLSTVITLSAENRFRLTATYLAQECVELTRNARDTAWRQRQDWLNPWGSSLALDQSFTIEPSFGITAKSVAGQSVLPGSDQSKLYLSGTGYTHEAAGNTETKFNRLLTVKSLSPTPIPTSGSLDQVRFSCRVWWGNDPSEQVELETLLTNWK